MVCLLEKEFSIRFMTRKTAHWTLLLFDIAGLLAGYYVFTEWTRINGLLTTQAETISFQNNFSYLSLMLLMPVIHAFTFIESLSFIKKWGNQILIGLLGFWILFAFLFSQNVEEKLSVNHYYYCESMSDQMTFSEFRVYLNRESECSK